MGIFLSARSQFPLLTDKNEFCPGLELSYQNKLFTINANGLATLGFGLRANSLPYESVPDINFSIPASFQWYFKEHNALVRVRLTALVGTSVDVIPSLGFGYTF